MLWGAPEQCNTFSFHTECRVALTSLHQGYSTPWPTGQIQPTASCHPTCRAPHGAGNVVVGEWWFPICKICACRAGQRWCKAPRPNPDVGSWDGVVPGPQDSTSAHRSGRGWGVRPPGPNPRGTWGPSPGGGTGPGPPGSDSEPGSGRGWC